MKKLIILFVLSICILQTIASDLNKLFDFYNPNHIAQLLLENNYNNLSKQCDQDMIKYSKSLISGDLWASKMSDASGRYSGGFLWGNNFWLGSSDLCTELRHSEDLNAPETAFSVVKVGFQFDNKNITATYRTVYVGMCLPATCNLKDVQNIFELSSSTVTSTLPEGGSRNVTILAIKSPDLDDYKFWLDPAFIILAIVTALVSILMVVGSTYDCQLRRQLRLQMNSIHECQPIQCQHCKQSKDGAIALDVINVPSNDNKKHGAKTVVECNGNHAIDSYGNTEALVEVKLYKEKKQLDKEKASWSQYGRAILLCFSVPQNARAIFDQSVGGDTLSAIHGLRFFSMVWVIIGHSCIVAFKYADNTNFRAVVEREFLFQTISNAAFSVDTFFFISGLLFSFLYFRTAAKVDLNVITKATGFKSKFLQMIGLLTYRFGRLTAPYLFVLGVVQISMKWFHHKSVFDPPTLDHENCPKYWWRNVLYINTLFPVKDMCMLWSWYLADDSQFYVLGAILMILAVSRFRTAAGLFVTFLMSSWITTAYIAYTNNHQPSVDDPLALFDKIYDKPWTRLGPYLVGMGTGWLLYNIDCKLKLNRGGVALGWSLAAATMLSLLYGLYDARLDAISSAAYSSLSHSAWALGTAWIVVACSTGHGGPVRKILSAPILYPLSRVTYCAYLVHPLIIRSMVMYIDTPLHLSRLNVTLLFVGHTVVSYMIAFAVSLAFEAPVVALLRLVSPKKDRSSSSSPSTSTQL